MKLGFSLSGSYDIESHYAKKSANRCSWRFAPRYLRASNGRKFFEIVKTGSVLRGERLAVKRGYHLEEL